MILHTALISLLLIYGWAINRPLLQKPFSEDDGNWFYPAVFSGKGIRLEDFKWRYSLFGVHWLGIVGRRLTGKNDSKTFYGLKIVWYDLTAAVIYLLAVVAWNQPCVGFLGGLFFLTITAIPTTLFSLTYGEHFFNLPVFVAVIFFILAGQSHHLIFSVAAGFFMGWACHMKPTVMLVAIWMPVMAFLSPVPLVSASGYVVGFAMLNLLPALYLWTTGGSAFRDFLLLFGTVLIMLCKMAQLLKLNFIVKPIEKVLSKHDQIKKIETYINRNHSLSWRDQWCCLLTNMKPVAVMLRMVIIFAAAQLFLLFYQFDPFVFSIISIIAIYLLMQQTQKNYYTPHFNAVWAPLGLLAAKTVYQIVPIWKENVQVSVVLTLFMIMETIRVILAVRDSFRQNRTLIFGNRSPMLDILFRKCEEIGAFIQDHSKPDDKLFVWGDQPSIYLYAQREIFNQDHLILYAHNNRLFWLKELINDLWQNPPEYILFYNYKVNDGWTMDRVQGTIGVKYDQVNVFHVTDPARVTPQNPQGIFFQAPLYKRDDTQYRRVLLERSATASKKGEIERAKVYLNTLLTIFPDDYEALLMIKLLQISPHEIYEAIKFMENELARHIGEVNKTILLKKLGELNAREGHLQEAGRQFSEALSRNPQDPFCWNALGQIFYKANCKQDAARYFHKAYEIDEYSAETLNNIGVILAEQGRLREAINALNRAKAYLPDHPLVINNIRRLTCHAVEGG
jgi:tetratricopeptide (TPR) repeat protein